MHRTRSLLQFLNHDDARFLDAQAVNPTGPAWNSTADVGDVAVCRDCGTIHRDFWYILSDKAFSDSSQACASISAPAKNLRYFGRLVTITAPVLGIANDGCLLNVVNLSKSNSKNATRPYHHLPNGKHAATQNSQTHQRRF